MNKELREIIDALEISLSLIDTPIARRKLGLVANDEKIVEIREALFLARKLARGF